MALINYRTTVGRKPGEVGTQTTGGSASSTMTTQPGGTLTTGRYAGSQLGPGVTADAAGNLYVNGKPVQFTTGGQQGQIVGASEADAIRAAGGTVTRATDVLTPSGKMSVEQYNVVYDPASRRVPLNRPATGSGSSSGTGGTPFTSADVMEGRLALGQPATPRGAEDYTYDLSNLPNPYAVTVSGGGGGLTSAQSLADRLARQGASNQQAYLLSLMSQTPTQYSGLLSNLASAFAPARTAAETAYSTALTALQGRRAQAQELLGQGQTALSEYLRANPQRAFATAQQAQAPQLAPDAVARYAAAIGAPTAGLGAAAVEAAVGAQGAVDAYNRMLQQRQASETQQNASRLAELEMLKNVQAAGLESLYGGGAQQLEAQRQAALAQIAQQQSAQEFALRQAQLAREQALQQALLGVYGTGYVNPLNFGV